MALCVVKKNGIMLCTIVDRKIHNRINKLGQIYVDEPKRNRFFKLLAYAGQKYDLKYHFSNHFLVN